MTSTRAQTLPLSLLDRIISIGASRVGKRDVAMDLFAFAGTVAFATVFRWQARDVIWGLWISSLCVGYATIVIAIARGIREAIGEFKLLGILGGLGALAFFTVHFGGFHFGHGAILNTFFPLVKSGDRAPSIFDMIAAALRSYWPLVVASFLSRLSDVYPRTPASFAKDAFAGPYGNVVRMHLLIFVFAGLHMADLSQLAILPVLAAYFFPWKAVFTRSRG